MKSRPEIKTRENRLLLRRSGGFGFIYKHIRHFGGRNVYEFNIIIIHMNETVISHDATEPSDRSSEKYYYSRNTCCRRSSRKCKSFSCLLAAQSGPTSIHGRR